MPPTSTPTATTNAHMPVSAGEVVELHTIRRRELQIICALGSASGVAAFFLVMLCALGWGLETGAIR
jgi:hypothetical protein